MNRAQLHSFQSRAVLWFWDNNDIIDNNDNNKNNIRDVGSTADFAYFLFC